MNIKSFHTIKFLMLILLLSLLSTIALAEDDFKDFEGKRVIKYTRLCNSDSLYEKTREVYYAYVDDFGEPVQHGPYQRYSGSVGGAPMTETSPYYSREQGVYRDGKRDGLFTEYDRGNLKKVEKTYHLGKLDGEVTFYDAEGNVMHQQFYVAGLLDGVEKLFESGSSKMIGERVWKSGRPWQGFFRETEGNYGTESERLVQNNYKDGKVVSTRVWDADMLDW